MASAVDDVEPTHAVNVEPPHADPGPVHVARLAAALRGDKLINDVEIIPGPGATITVLIVPQGFRPGHVLRARVMRLAPDAGHRLQVALVREVLPGVQVSVTDSFAVWPEPVGRLPHNGNGKIDRPAVRRVPAACAEARAGGDD